MVFSLSGKRLYGLVPVSATRKKELRQDFRFFFSYDVCSLLASSKQEKVVALVKQYTECINQLQSFGALLNNIQPEYLLSDEDHALYCDYRRIQAVNTGRKGE